MSELHGPEQPIARVWPLSVRILLFIPVILWVGLLLFPAMIQVCTRPLTARLAARRLRATAQARGLHTAWKRVDSHLAHSRGTILRVRTCPFDDETLWWIPESLSARGIHLRSELDQIELELRDYTPCRRCHDRYLNPRTGTAYLLESTFTRAARAATDARLTDLAARFPNLEVAVLTTDAINQARTRLG